MDNTWYWKKEIELGRIRKLTTEIGRIECFYHDNKITTPFTDSIKEHRFLEYASGEFKREVINSEVPW